MLNERSLGREKRESMRATANQLLSPTPELPRALTSAPPAAASEALRWFSAPLRPPSPSPTLTLPSSPNLRGPPRFSAPLRPPTPSPVHQAEEVRLGLRRLQGLAGRTEARQPPGSGESDTTTPAAWGGERAGLRTTRPRRGGWSPRTPQRPAELTPPHNPHRAGTTTPSSPRETN